VLALILVAALVARTTTPSRAAELVIDNTDPAVQVRGTWATTTTTGGFLGPNYLFRTSGNGLSSVTWPFPPAAAGNYEVFARWSAGPNRATNAPYAVVSNGGTQTIVFNQRTNGGTWQSLGSFEFQPGKGQGVSLSDKADGVVVADAVRFVGPVSAAGAPSAPTPAPPGAPVQPQSVAAQPHDARYFQQTGYRIANDAFWSYFRARGGERSFGFPVSNTFTLLGLQTQLLQRQIMQIRPDGAVQTMNVLDEGLLPYTRMNGSTFPPPDPAVIALSPKLDDPRYHAQTLEFVRSMAPDTFEGEPVNFGKTFFNSVRAEDAFPTGMPAGAAELLPYFNLELWGLPTSRPARDPNNPGFIYVRFQRGIMHYDKACGCTQGLLLADDVKSLLTGANLPPDLVEQARGSKLLNQFRPGQPQSLARPAELPGSDLSNAFRREPTVTLDAGHGGTQIGTAHVFDDGTRIAEKDLNLRVMLRVRDVLSAAGFRVTVTRTSDAPVNADGRDLTGDGRATLSDDLQARVDVANRAGSDIFVSIHFNGAADPGAKGTYVFWDADQTYAERSKTLAELVDAALVKSMADAGYMPANRGAATDTSVLGGDRYYLLSPKTDIVTRPSSMPAVIGEALFLSNPEDANALRKDAIVEAVSRGYVEGIKAYFARFPVS
jgi:N-acetylmuramoyl-L-alanine amidase